ncbi:energy-coupling factor transporter transmembrane component T [Demequina pelophila]|uniref:energy-coupling factor transporter transmembrane component T n=1 Tax=Demequina pelophila TaxID=1638984 RepID=UPI0007840FDA|nr:energy-coupling factor transporter transmembrane component T [Demequina pelophila]
MISLFGLYRRRRTPMHLAPAWFKVLLMLGLSVACLIISEPVTSIGITAACLLLLASTLPPAKATLKGMSLIIVIAALTTLFQVWRGDYIRALDLAGDLISIAALALAIASSTSMEEMLDFVSTMAQPLRWILPPDTIGVMVALTLRALPEAARIMVEARIAARARGMDRSLRAVLVPSATRSVGFALQLGQALHARGIAETGRRRKDVLPSPPREREKVPMAPPPVREPEAPAVPVKESRRERRRRLEAEAAAGAHEPGPEPALPSFDEVVTGAIPIVTEASHGGAPEQDEATDASSPETTRWGRLSPARRSRRDRKD